MNNYPANRYHPARNLTHSNNVSGNPTLTCSYDDENQLVEMLYSDGIGEESFLESAGSGWRSVFTYVFLHPPGSLIGR